MGKMSASLLKRLARAYVFKQNNDEGCREDSFKRLE
jgi:hypothetical protein